MSPQKELFKAYRLNDYPSVASVRFPKELHIAYAVCGKKCGNKEFIVEGQSQVCQYCGRLMFRIKNKKYILSKSGKKKSKEVKS